MVILRHATAADADAIARVHVVSHREAYAGLLGDAYWPQDVAVKRRVWAAAIAAGDSVHVAEEAGEIIGFGHATGDEITTLYLRATHHRRGIGSGLLRRLLADLHGAGHKAARFNVLAVNRAAIAFYEAQGARLTGTEDLAEPGVVATYVDHVYTIPTAAGEHD